MLQYTTVSYVTFFYPFFANLNTAYPACRCASGVYCWLLLWLSNGVEYGCFFSPFRTWFTGRDAGEDVSLVRDCPKHGHRQTKRAPHPASCTPGFGQSVFLCSSSSSLFGLTGVGFTVLACRKSYLRSINLFHH